MRCLVLALQQNWSKRAGMKSGMRGAANCPDQAHSAGWARDEALVLDALGRAGVNPGSITALMHGNTPAAAVPALLHSLTVVTDEAVLDTVVRTLTTPAARGVAEPALIRLFDRLDGHEPTEQLVRWTIGNAIFELDPVHVAMDVRRIAADVQVGLERQMFVEALGRLDPADVEDILPGLITDQVVTLHAIAAARRLRSEACREPLKKIAKNGTGPQRRAAAAALTKLRPPSPG